MSLHSLEKQPKSCSGSEDCRPKLANFLSGSFIDQTFMIDAGHKKNLYILDF